MGRPPLPIGAHGVIKAWQEGNGWVARARFRHTDGKVYPVKRNGRTSAAARRRVQEALAEFEAPVQAGALTNTTRFRDAADLWLAEVMQSVEDGERAGGTLDVYRSVMRTWIVPRIGDLRICEVTTPAVDAVVRAVKAGASASRTKHAKTAMSGVMGLAIRRGAFRGVNPVDGVGRIVSEPKAKARALTAAERKMLIDGLNADEKARRFDLPDVAQFMLGTGCRIGEVLALSWAEIDLDGGSVDVAWRLTRSNGTGLQRKPSTKTGEKGERVLPLPTWAVTMLKRRKLATGGAGPVFPSSRGGWRDPSNLRTVWREVVDKCLPDTVTHALRKTVATMLDEAGLSAREIADQLGHAKVSMTQDVYMGRARGVEGKRTGAALEGMA